MNNDEFYDYLFGRILDDLDAGHHLVVRCHVGGAGGDFLEKAGLRAGLRGEDRAEVIRYAQAIAQRPSSLLYSLHLEDGTHFYRNTTPGPIRFADSEWTECPPEGGRVRHPETAP